MKIKETNGPPLREQELSESPPLMERSKIKHDTYLSCWCPHCAKGLNDGDKAVLEIVDNQGQVGPGVAAAYLNVLEQETSILFDEDEDLIDVRCPHCQASLLEERRVCKEDGCKLIGLHVSISDSKKLKLISCIRRSCRWYEMSEEDNERLILRDSHEW